MTYETKSGDCWDWIAFQELGSTRYTPALIDANRQYVGTFIFSAGIILTLPEVEPLERKVRLPPWRK